jgi:RNA polymerase sigma-70 factor (ECF subfamily)
MREVDVGRKTNDRESESALIARILSGDRELFHELIRPYEQVVFRMAMSMLKSEAEAEDAAQSAILLAYANLASYRGESRFSTWLVTIVLNEGRSRLRKTRSLREDSLDGLSEESEGDFTPALLTDWREIPSATLERKEVRTHLENAIAQLPPLYREVLTLRDVQGMDIEETAHALSITPATVKVRLHRARRMMQKSLAPVLKSYAPRSRGWFGGWS